MQPDTPPKSQEHRRSRQRQESRRVILDATEALIVEDGIEEFSIRKLAARCGFSAPTVYHHFGDKDGLIDALLQERFERLLRGVRRVPTGQDPVENLRQMCHAFLRFGLSNPRFYRLMMTAGPDGADRVTPAAEESRDLLEAPWRDLAAAGRLRDGDVEAAKQSLWALCHGLIALRIGRPNHPWSDNQIEVGLDSMLRGLVRPERDANGRGTP